jgi:hypothetical protein
MIADDVHSICRFVKNIKKKLLLANTTENPSSNPLQKACSGCQVP